MKTIHRMGLLMRVPLLLALLQRVAEVFVLISPPYARLLWLEPPVSAPAVLLTIVLLNCHSSLPNLLHLMSVTGMCCCCQFSVHFLPRVTPDLWHSGTMSVSNSTLNHLGREPNLGCQRNLVFLVYAKYSTSSL